MREKTGTREPDAGARSGPKLQGSPVNRAHVSGKPGNVGPVAISKAGAAGTPRSTGESLEQSVFRSLEQYFANLDGAKPHALHEMVLGAIEKPLLQFALQRCEGNQSAAADLLGINRNTLRRKLQDYGLH
jgi:Fis family transcriptional regulator